MIVINVLPCLEALTTLHKYYEDQYLLEEDKQAPAAQHFFYVRASILSFLISQDALTDAYVKAPNELEPSLRHLQDLLFEKYNEDKEVYFVETDKVYA